MASDGAIKLVCFDLGGVLLRICRSWPEGCAAAGLDVRAKTSDANGWHAPREINDLYQTGCITCDEFALRFSQSTGKLYTPAEIMQVHRAWILGEYPHVGDLIAHIHHSGLETAALSNTNHGHWQQIQAFGSVMQLQHRLASHELRLHKPDPAIYRELEHRLNRRGREILFFDDLSENVAAAREVGWLAEQIDPLGCTATQMRDYLERHHVLLPRH